ncbi:tetratricopeptide repeat protein [Nereida sp.]|uniref:tetratricopeptide repeat protein n=1 Tax=Nereida sp. TaxID=2736090 RepID=UPI003F69B2EB
MRRYIRPIVLSATLLLPAVGNAQGVAGSYLAGRHAQFNGDYAAVGQYYSQAQRSDAANPTLLEAALAGRANAGDVAGAVALLRGSDLDMNQNQIAGLIAVAGLAKDEQFTEIVEGLGAGRRISPLVDGLVVAWATLGLGDVSAATDYFEDMASMNGMSGFANLHHALAKGTFGDFEGALGLLTDDKVGALGYTRRSIMVRAEFLSQLGRNMDAAALIDDNFQRALDPELQELRSGLEGRKAVPLTTVLSAQQGLAEVFWTVASVLRDEAGPDFALLYARAAAYVRADFDEANLLIAGLLDELGNHVLAANAYGQITPDSTSFHAAEIGRAEALFESDRKDAAVEALTALQDSHGDLQVVHSTLGDMLRRLERFEEATAAYSTAIKLLEQGDPNAWFLYYARGITFERRDLWPQAEADFRKALTLNPDQPNVLNYLGYSLVEKKIKLDEALEMIETAAAARPDSGFILDSLGWVLYRLGRYDEAVAPMEVAASLAATDPVVNDHLGDVLWAVGRRTEARFQWSRALSFDPAEDDLPRIRRKLEVGLDVVLEDEGAPPLPPVQSGG